MIDVRQLRYFLALAEHLHFGRAAEALHITQPPLSRQIAALEETLGTQLFARHSRAVELTASGREFQQHCRNLLAGLDLAVRSAQASARGERGELRLSFTMVAAWTLLPTLLKRYRDAYPQVKVVLNEVLPRDLGPALEAGEADVALTFPTADGSPLLYRSLLEEPLCAVLPAGHHLAQGRRLDVAALAGEDFISFPPSTAPALHRAVMQSCAEHGFEPRVRLEPHLQQTIVNLVAEGLGVALVPDSMRKMQLPGAVFRPLRRSPLVDYGVAWSAHNHNPCLAAFLACAGIDQAA
ncbi:MAG: HTH-type transcriptional regulator GltC [Stenotrophomonas maltophilia]|nr:MAG: HTH-type transcriptional regulator GltC [Stenotrophomonas maltophilia]